jgi:hypothetical protein
MKKLTRIEDSILLELYKSSGKIDSFSLFRKVKIPFPEFLSSLKDLENSALIRVQDLNIELERNAVKRILKAGAGRMPLPNPLSGKNRFQRPAMLPGQPYIPSIQRLDKKRFSNLGFCGRKD